MLEFFVSWVVISWGHNDQVGRGDLCTSLHKKWSNNVLYTLVYCERTSIYVSMKINAVLLHILEFRRGQTDCGIVIKLEAVNNCTLFGK